MKQNVSVTLTDAHTVVYENAHIQIEDGWLIVFEDIYVAAAPDYPNKTALHVLRHAFSPLAVHHASEYLVGAPEVTNERRAHEQAKAFNLGT